MTTTTPHPPTTLHENIPLTPSSAESFLSTFLADASQKPNQNEIVLTNLLRVQRALAGVYVPPSPPAAVAVAAAMETEVLTKGETGVDEIVGEGAGGGEYGEGRVGDDKERGGVEIVPGMGTAEAGGVDRERKRERKARRRRREEKVRKRAKKGKGEKEDGSE